MKSFFIFINLASLLAFIPAQAMDEPIAVGANAPILKSMDENGNSVHLGDLYGKGLVLVYFYPKADTPGCTKQACSLRDAYTTLSDLGVTVVGVSMDTAQDQLAFKEKYNLPFTLLADKSGEVVKAFGVPVRMRGENGFASRQAFLIEDGKVVWRDLKASTEEQAKDVLAVLASR